MKQKIHVANEKSSGLGDETSYDGSNKRGRYIPGVSIANNFDLNTLVHSRGEDSADEILVHPASEFTHPTTCKSMLNKSVDNHVPKSLAGRIIRKPGGNITTTLTVGGRNCKAGRINTRRSLGSSISL